MKKTNVARILDRAKIPYALKEYEVDPDDLGAANVARKVGLPPGQLFKTLVARGDRRGFLLACVSGADELDLKALAAASGDKHVEMAPLKEVQGVTGYIRGGVSPIGTKKKLPVYVDESMRRWEFVAVSAGVRGLQVFLSPDDLQRVTEAVICRIGRS